MAWTYDQIQNEWLGGAHIAVPEDECTSAFERVERFLGSGWLHGIRTPAPGVVCRGSAPTARIIQMGRRLACIEDVKRTEALVGQIRRGDLNAEAELTALFILRSNSANTSAELAPAVGRRLADFRIRQGNGAWTYVEVTRPSESEAYRQASRILHKLCDQVEILTGSLAIELFLRREPTAQETNWLIQFISDVGTHSGVYREELPDHLGLFILNATAPGQVILEEHEGEERVPRISCVRTIAGPSDHRHICARLAFSDDRAEEFLRGEARQLPKDSPGLVMVQVSHATGALRTWEKTLRRRLQPNLHTRVSGVCLFCSGLSCTETGDDYVDETQMVANVHASLALPAWILNAI